MNIFVPLNQRHPAHPLITKQANWYTGCYKQYLLA